MWSGCKNEQELKELNFENIAAVTGDFDQVEETLTRLDIATTAYEGYIDRAVYDPSIQPEANSLKSEQLFEDSDDSNVPEISRYEAVFVDSGTRGFGAWVYNGTDADDSLVTNPTVIAHVQDYVTNGGTLIVSDWAYDLVEACWPDAIEFAGEDTELDDAQRGTSDEVTADVLDLDLQDALSGNTTLAVQYDYSYWTAIESVGPETEVYLSGDVTYHKSGAEGDVALLDSPLLVGFQSEGGQVLFSTFHWRAQRSEVSQDILLGLIDGLSAGPGYTADSGGSNP